MQIEIEFLSETTKLPEKMSGLAAGYDLFADLPSALTLLPGQRLLVGTGFALSIPAGYEGQIRPRSGLANKHGITVLNSPGTIDADYRGEIKVLLINLSHKPFSIQPQMRIAQIVFAKHEQICFQLVQKLSHTDRGLAGFGSSDDD